jgi:hypothetical protein
MACCNHPSYFAASGSRFVIRSNLNANPVAQRRRSIDEVRILGSLGIPAILRAMGALTTGWFGCEAVDRTAGGSDSARVQEVVVAAFDGDTGGAEGPLEIFLMFAMFAGDPDGTLHELGIGRWSRD